MDATAIRQYIEQTFAGVEVTEAYGCAFFFYGADHMFPFATIATTDENDQASNLSRPDVFRVNVGVSKQTFASLFGDADTDSHDFTAMDRIMPHPVYGNMYWICVLNPSDATFQKVQALLTEAYDTAVRKRARKTSGGEA
jgi:hypothetical protein